MTDELKRAREVLSVMNGPLGWETIRQRDEACLLLYRLWPQMLAVCEEADRMHWWGDHPVQRNLDALRAAIREHIGGDDE